MSELGARVRLVKGAYKEPDAVALQRKGEVDASFRHLTRLLLDTGTYPAIATHDAALIDDACAYAAERAIPPERYEFQMLYGIRRDLQAGLVAGVVSLLHASTWGASGQRRLRRPKPAQRKQVGSVVSPLTGSGPQDRPDCAALVRWPGD
jgi:hypothetical protein